MNKPIGNRDKRIALLLIAIFTWLFTVSLIIFHFEHVLGRHSLVKSELFISPKLKDKQNLSLKLVKLVLKLKDNIGSASIINHADYSAVVCQALDTNYHESSPFFTDESLHVSGPLRAPPVI
jgi:hypothetical protein